jgi:hypothetical protein
MRRIQIDPAEFDPPSSEQHLDLAISSSKRTVVQFLSDCGASKPSGSTPGESWGRRTEVLSNVRQFAGIEIGREAVLTLLNDEWNDLEAVIESGDGLIWYHWYTTA